MKQQIILVHGGNAFDTYEEYLLNLRAKEFYPESLMAQGWKDTFQEKLGSGFEVLAPQMPNKQNAKYLEWEIWFEKLFPFLQNDVILIGHSLGGIFLARFLSEQSFPVRIRATVLIGAPCNTPSEHPLADFILHEHLDIFSAQAGEIVLFHSTDDTIVPYSNARTYRALAPSARLETFENRGHFNEERFPELEALVRDISSKS
ncbi:alpha/beta hydrolase [Candidatus Uhrbacteria bacterium]|nr:alpha/beta hydrolase [Candidatus Uhrbacteria bacterium]